MYTYGCQVTQRPKRMYVCILLTSIGRLTTMLPEIRLEFLLVRSMLTVTCASSMGCLHDMCVQSKQIEALRLLADGMARQTKYTPHASREHFYAIKAAVLRLKNCSHKCSQRTHRS